MTVRSLGNVVLSSIAIYLSLIPGRLSVLYSHLTVAVQSILGICDLRPKHLHHALMIRSSVMGHIIVDDKNAFGFPGVGGPFLYLALLVASFPSLCRCRRRRP